MIKRNYEAFVELLPNLVKEHGGKFALMREGKVIEFFDTARDAYFAGLKLYPEQMFSVQEVVEIPVELGFFSQALS